MINCEQCTEHVHGYLDGEPVPGSSRAGMWMHHVLCGPCRRYMKQIQDVIQVGATIADKDREDFECSEAFKDALVKQYKKTNPGL